MLNDQISALTVATDNRDYQPPIVVLRDIHALSPPRAPRETTAGSTISRRSSTSLSAASSENLPSMSTEFNALVLAGSTVGTGEHEHPTSNYQLDRIREEETNPLAIVPDNYNTAGPARSSPGGSERLALSSNTSTRGSGRNRGHEVTVHEVKKEEVESRISAWEDAKIAKINNRFKREDAVINGWEGEQVQKASTWMKKVERKLEEKRAKAHEKMQNEIAKAHRKAEERRASSEAKRGTKVARVLEVANLMRAVGRPPVKRSFF